MHVFIRIAPRWDRNDDKAAAVVMDLNIVREVKGSMPDVVYPHKQHTEWLDCSNCHPKIFVPQKGANQISMASILLGQQCGACHGKVAFPACVSAGVAVGATAGAGAYRDWKIFQIRPPLSSLTYREPSGPTARPTGRCSAASAR